MSTTPLEVAAASEGESATTVLSGLGLCLASTVVAMARMGFCAPVAFATRRPLATTAAGFAGGFLMDSLTRLAIQNDAGTSVLKATPWSPDLPLTPDGSGADIVTAMCISLAFVAAWFAISWWIFRKADVG